MGFKINAFQEDFEERALQGGGTDGETSVQLMEWHWDCDPNDTSYQVEFSLLIRKNGKVFSHHECHTLALFSRLDYREALTSCGFELISIPEAPYLFARKPAENAKKGAD